MKIIADELRYGRHFLTFAVLRTLGQSLGFVLPLLIARLLAPDTFGAYTLSIMVAYLATAVLINSSGSPFIVFASRELRERNKINRSFTIRLIIVTGAVAVFGLLSVLFVSPLSRFTTVGTPQLVFLFLAYVGLGIRFLFESVFLALDRRTLNATYGIVQGFVAIVLTILVYVFLNLTLGSIFLIFFVAPLVAALLMLRWVDRDKVLPLVFDRDLLSEMLGYTKWMILGATTVFIIGWGDTFVLRFFVPLRDIGTYHLGYQMLKGTIVLIGTVKMYFLPFLSQNTHDREKIRKYLSEKRLKIMLLGSLGLVLLMAVLPRLLGLLYGDAYTGVVSVAMILLISSFFVLYRSFYGALFEAFRRYRFTQLANICFVVLNIGLDVVLVMRFGMIGAAIATTITYAVSVVVYEVYFQRHIKPELLPAQ